MRPPNAVIAYRDAARQSGAAETIPMIHKSKNARQPNTN
jgi:hypothetical protein